MIAAPPCPGASWGPLYHGVGPSSDGHRTMATNMLRRSQVAAPATRSSTTDWRFRPATTLESLRGTWRSRHLLHLLGVFAIRRMFRLTLLGPLWLIIHVAMDILSKTFIFGGVLNVQTPNGVPYIMFLLTGMLGWRLFQHTLTFGIKSFQRFRGIVRDLDFPLLIVPVAATAQALVEFALYAAVLAAGFAYYWIKAGNILFETGPQLLLAPLGLLGCLVLGWGLCCWLAPINYRMRDVRFMLSYAVGFWLYLTPVVYPLSRLDGFPLLLAKLNPMAPLIEMIKFGLIGGGNIGPEFAAYGLGVSAVIFITGLMFLNRVGPRILREPAAVNYDDDEEEEL